MKFEGNGLTLNSGKLTQSGHCLALHI